MAHTHFSHLLISHPRKYESACCVNLKVLSVSGSDGCRLYLVSHTLLCILLDDDEDSDANIIYLNTGESS